MPVIPDRTILVIETCFRQVSAVLWHGGRSYSHLSAEPNKQAEITASMVQELLEEAGITPQDLDQLCCTIGPGSFTGVRIGLSLFQSMAEILNIPLVTLTTTEVVAFLLRRQKIEKEGIVEVNLPSKRGFMYQQQFLAKNLAAVGEIEEITLPDDDSMGNVFFLPLAWDVLDVLKYYTDIGYQPPVYPTPLYVRGPDAKKQS